MTRRVEDQAEVVGVRQDALDEAPARGCQAVLALLVVEEVLPLAGQRHVGVHAVAVDPGDRLGQEAGGHFHPRRDLTRQQLVELHLVGGDGRLGVGVVHLELRRRHFGMVLLVGEAHRPLHLGGAVDEQPQRVAGQRVVVAAGRDEVENAGLVVAALGVAAAEQEALDLVGGVAHRLVLGPQLVGVGLQPGAHVGAIRPAVALLHLAEHQHLAGAEYIRRQPVESRPVDLQAQVGLGLLREAADRGAVEGQVVGRLEQEFLVVVEHVQPAFEVGEAHRHCLDALLVGEVLDARLADLVDRLARHALLLGGEVHLLELVVGDLQEIPQRADHRTASLPVARLRES